MTITYVIYYNGTPFAYNYDRERAISIALFMSRGNTASYEVRETPLRFALLLDVSIYHGEL